MRFFTTFFLTFSLVLFSPGLALGGPVIIKDLKRSKSAWFYNKPGATANEVNRDEYNCTAFGHHMFTMSPYNDGDPYVEHSGVVGSLIGGAVSSGPIRGSKDDCMMSLGYKRFNTEDATLKDFMSRYNLLNDSEKDKYHGDVVPPEGTLHRQWVNTFWIPAEGEPMAQVETRNFMPIRQDLPKGEFIRWEMIDGNETMPVISEGDDKAILIAKIKPVADKPAEIRFARVDPHSGAPDVFLNAKGKEKLPVITLSQKNKKLNEYAVFTVPAGHYALNAVRYHAMCMKTVVLDVKSGQTIYLGEYTGYKNKAQVHELAPTPRARFRLDDGNLEEVKTDLTLSDTPIAADYRNNFPMMCPAAIGEKMYGVSIPGRPNFVATPH